MYVEEIHIEGFKSYAKKTTLSGFDPHFNAITGLNGSGKSNILDSICFVLGITNLSQVRAGNLQDLVYKQGQAGITKASVSITFDNSDKKNSPVGYEDKDKITVTRQVVIGGKNKYLINGHLAQPGKVQTLFHSVQLNVNNPHFLIMQGRITKVLNMKPPEILGMLEEAAGTRMYENKKDNALRTLRKKDLKVEEINNMLDNDILPALERLRGERSQYLEWMANKSNVEKLQRVCIAHDYWKANSLAESSQDSYESMSELTQTVRSSLKHTADSISELGEEIKNLKNSRDSHRGADVNALESEEKEVSKSLVKETTVWEHRKKQVVAEKENIDKVVGEKEAALSNVSFLERKIEESKKECQEVESQLQSHTKKLQRIETELNGFVVSATDSKSKTIGEVLAEAKQDVARLESDIKQITKKIERRESDLKKKTKDLGRFEAEKADMEAESKEIEKKVKELTLALGKKGFDPAREESLKKEVNVMSATIRELKSKAQALSAQLVKFDFQYTNPSQDFDQSSVKGVVAKLVRVDDPEYTTALEVVAGAKLSNVVVDNEKTAAALLKRGQLKSRVTIIPLNKIDSKAIQNPVRSHAQKLVGKDNARVALELIGYDEEVENAMKYVFGKTFVCSDSIAAQKVAFAKEIKKTCVTRDGDLLNPSGTLTGGSRPTSHSVLSKLRDLFACEAEIKRLEDSISSMQSEIQELSQLMSQSRSQEQELKLAKHELELLEARISQSNYSKSLKEVEEIKAEIMELDSSRQKLVEDKSSKAEDVQVFQRQMKDFGKSRDDSRSQLEKNLESGRRELSAIQKKLQERNNKVEMAVLELESAKEEVEAIEEQLVEARKQCQEAESQAAAAEAIVKQIHTKYEGIKAELDKKLESLIKHDKKMSAVAQEKEKKEKQYVEQEYELKNLEGRMKRLLHESEESKRVLEELLERNSWIETEKRYFNQPGSDYDFSCINPEESKKEYERLLNEQEKAGKRINKKVMSMFDKAEQEYRDLREKKEIVLRDKAKIEQAIDELDEKKKEALSKTWQKVDKDFGSIFSTLLPGTQAKLEPLEDRDFMDGLEVKVAFGDVWKQSLSELSGGQRSLLALSLILAMLLFKPAPIYILDEVDAALDLSHTQNIGRMIKRCFPYSQFLVVSLKPGLFSNANCIFTTKFVDGVSTVVKTSGKLEGHRDYDDNENDKENVLSR